MRIRAFHIDSFGILHQLEQDGLPGSLAIFLGNNEAGKSTLLDFFRSTLLGYPVRSKEPRDKAYLDQVASLNTAGGSLVLETNQLWRLTRRPTGLPMLSDLNGNPLDLSLYERLLAGVTREVYTSIYGFSLTELQNFSSLNSDGVRNALYGASFGQGLRSPGQALKKIEGMLDNLFKPGGSKPLISGLLRDLEVVQKDIRQAENALVKYDEYNQNLQEQEELLQQQIQTLHDLDQESRLLQRRLSLWADWETWELQRAKLARLENIPATFPQDGPHRLERALEKMSSQQQAVDSCQGLLEQSQLQLQGLNINLNLLKLSPELRHLAEHKASYRQAILAIPQLEAALIRQEELQVTLLTQLGSDWSLDKVLHSYRPLEQREKINTLIQHLQTESLEVNLNQQNVSRLTQELSEINQEIETAKQNFSALPAPIADLEALDREKLQAQLQRTKEALQCLPDAEQSLSQSRAEFNRALSQLHLQPKQNTAQTLETLSTAQSEILDQAKAVLTGQQELTQFKQLLDIAHDNEATAKKRLDRLQSQLEDLGDPSRQQWEKRRLALRNLRQNLTEASNEGQKLQEARERYTDHLVDTPKADHSLWLVALGLIFAAGGSAILVARQVMGITTFIVSEYMLPLELWLGYLVLAIGVCLVAAGWPRKRPEVIRHETLRQRLETMVSNLEEKLRTIQTNVQNLCSFLELTSIDPLALDALEAKLDALHNDCNTGERLQQELQINTSEYENTHQISVQQAANLAKKNAEIHTLRLRWHEHLQDYGLGQVPLPENIDTFFARVENAKMYWNQVKQQEKDVSIMQNQASLLCQLGRELLPKSFWPDHFNDIQIVIQACQNVLKSCHEADLAAEARAKAELSLQGFYNSQSRLEQMLAQEKQQQESLQAQLQASQTAWQEVLGELGLNPKFSVQTAQEALQLIDKILESNKEKARITDELQRETQARDALILPLQHILLKLEQTPSSDALQQLISLEHELEQEQLQAQRQAQLEQRITDQEHELNRLNSLLQDAQYQLNWLLKMAEAQDSEEFLRKSSIKTTRDALTQQIEQLEDSLRLAWNSPPFKEQSFNDFITAFTDNSKPDLESRLHNVEAQLLNLKEAKTQTEATRTDLRLRLDLLTQSESLQPARQQELDLIANLNTQAQDWAALALAKDLLLTARHNFEKAKQPEVIRLASQIFAQITQGKWINIQASLEDSTLLVISPQGEPLSPDLLSRGTQEQLYLALRLAHIQHQTQNLPIIMDDILVNFDPQRAKQTALAFNSICQADPQEAQDIKNTKAHQILFFTCHPHLADLLQKNVSGSVLYHLNQGKISMA